jgi:hypothetical protein
MDNLVTDLRTGKPPPILHNLHLVTWRIFGGSTPSRTSLAAPEISMRQGGAPPQKAATKEPGSLSRDIFVPPAFHSIELVTDVVNYLTLLHSRKLSYSTINLHRSAISMTLANVVTLSSPV